MLIICFAITFVIVGNLRYAKAITIGITNFTEITDATFHSLSANALSPIVMSGITITPSVLIVAGNFGFFTTGDVDNPGGGDGYFTGVDLGSADTIILDFSSPVAAFGASFLHMPPNRSLRKRIRGQISP